jgi:hypothetical protein
MENEKMTEQINKNFPMEMKKCPACGSTETMMKIALKQVTLMDKTPDKVRGFVCLNKVITPLIEPKYVAGDRVPYLVQYLDRCAGCGYLYPTRAEIVTDKKDLGLVKANGPLAN